ncbi:putative disease resistance protein At3g14460 [Mercurialis annua]|uniref:putative disease resistance protein At3g14460 n=1 Tax=Mercurialis annua TaxID=3986 RepID=UPI0024AE888B|nr:putative disease resistance protein At3g14460 [Mercurialis annua]
MRSFFQDLVKINNRYVFKMHDLVHDFAQSLMKNECCSIEVLNNEIEQRMIDFNPIEVRHVSIRLGPDVSFPSSFYNLRRLHSLIFLWGNGTMIGVALPKIFNELTCLRSLSLSGCDIREIPSNISKLIHLRQLDVSRNNKLKELPETVCQLYNLQTIDVVSCENLKCLPEGMGKLINLRYLNNDQTSFSLPKGIGRLSGLQKLCMVNICNNEQGEAAFILRDIKTLNQLGGSLTIEWRRQHVAEVDVEDAKQAELKNKKNLTDLKIYFSDEIYGVEWRKQQDEELLEALEPSTKLKSLTISDYLGTNKTCGHPNWITSMSSLRKINLGRWRNCENFPPFGALPWLESLRLLKFYSLKKVGIEFLGLDHLDISTAFPKLIDLQFQLIEEWEEWSDQDVGDNAAKIMPSLRFLAIWSCPKLKKLPNYILQKTALNIDIKDNKWTSLRFSIDLSSPSFGDGLTLTFQKSWKFSLTEEEPDVVELGGKEQIQASELKFKRCSVGRLLCGKPFNIKALHRAMTGAWLGHGGLTVGLTRIRLFNVPLNCRHRESVTKIAEKAGVVLEIRITLGPDVSFPSSFYNLRRLHSHIFLSGNGTMIRLALPKIFNELTCLRSLSLSGCDIREIPSNISKLIHLRQLDVSRNKELKELPETVCKLHNLQTIDVESCEMKCLPEGMGKLINLSNEQGAAAAFVLREVKKLNQLCGNLAINGEDNIDERYGVEWRKQQDEELLEALEPSTKLKSSTIYGITWAPIKFMDIRVELC